MNRMTQSNRQSHSVKRMAAVLTALTLMPLTCGSWRATAAEPTLVDSGVDYTESIETIPNPGMGYTSTLWYYCKPGDTPVKNPTGALVLMFIDIGAFSSGANCTRDDEGNPIAGTGVDYPLDDTFFAGLRGTFENCRKNGCTIALRFRYDGNGLTNPEPATYEAMVAHVQQIADSGLLEEYKDILMYVESGLVGCYGEQWGGKYCSIETKAELLDLWLDVVPDEIPVTVRTPNIFAKWAGIATSELGDWVSEPHSRAARVGLYNDGYMGSNSDLGTYGNREIETKWLHHQTFTSYFGGEFSGNLSFAQQYDTYLPENALPEMYYTHLSYINSNIYSLYKDYTYSAAYDVGGADNSSYYGQNVWKFMRDHLGYRFVLRDSDLSANVPQGGALNLAFSVENTGFANPIREQKAEILLEKDGNYIRTEVDLDSRSWHSCETVNAALTLQIPGGLEAGAWNVYLKLSVGDNTVSQVAKRSVRFANENVWNDAIGANYLGSFTVTADASGALVREFAQTNAAHPVAASQGTVYSVNGSCTPNGILSHYGERDPERMIAENDKGEQLFLWSDEDYFYISASMKNTAVSPVYNVQLLKKGEEKRYWLYFESGGGVYFNSGSHEGSFIKYSSDAVEFCIPLEMMQVERGTEFEYVRLFLQDSSIPGWELKSDLKSGAATLDGCFDIYTAQQTVTLAAGDTMDLRVETSAKNPTYQWMHDGTPIAGAQDVAYMLPAADAQTKGDYSVLVTSESGLSKEVCVLRVLDVGSELPRGDVNGDGQVTMADVVLLQKYLLCMEQLTVAQGARAEFTGDGKLTAADLTLLKRILIK